MKKLRLKEFKEFIHLDVRALVLDDAASFDILISDFKETKSVCTLYLFLLYSL